MDLRAAVVADEQTLEVVQPGEGALDDPARTTEPGAVLGLTAGDDGFDASLADEAAVLVVVVAAVGDNAGGPPAGAPDGATHGRHLVQQRDQLGDVVAVAAGDGPGEGDSARLYEKVVLGARSGSINRARARRGAPFFACT